jgi:hypothetical protein
MLTLPKEHISVSQVQLWEQDPIAYQKKYFIGIPDKPSPFMDFGKQFATDIEDYRNGVQRDFNFPNQFLETTHIYPYVEYKLEHDFTTFKFLGFIDNMSEDYEIVVDFKTGTAPWTQARLEESLQMQLYSTVIFYQFQVLPTCFINYWQTRLKGKEVLWTNVNEIYRHTFGFKELAAAEMRVRKAATEISEAYDKYLNSDLNELFHTYTEWVELEKTVTKEKEIIKGKISSILKDEKLALKVNEKLITYSTYQRKSYQFSENIQNKESELKNLQLQEISSGEAVEEVKTVTLINVRDERVEQ